MTKEQFKDWYEKFADKKSFIPKDIDAFISRNEESHQELNERIEGKTLTVEVPIPASFKQGVSSQCQKIINDINRIIPEYKAKYNLTDVDISSEKLIKCKNINTSKHILTYGKLSKLTRDKQDLLSDEVCKLGQFWATSKKLNEKLSITITTEPRAFIILGSTALCLSSCFVQNAGNCYGVKEQFTKGGMNSDKKYSFAVGKNTFMLFVNKGKFSIDDLNQGYKPMYRAVGAFTDGLNTMSTCNIRPSDNARDQLPSIVQEIYKKISKNNHVEVSLSMFKWKGGCNYIESPINTYATKTIKKIIEFELTTDYSKEFKDVDTYANW